MDWPNVPAFQKAHIAITNSLSELDFKSQSPISHTHYRHNLSKRRMGPNLSLMGHSPESSSFFSNPYNPSSISSLLETCKPSHYTPCTRYPGYVHASYSSAKHSTHPIEAHEFSKSSFIPSPPYSKSTALTPPPLAYPTNFLLSELNDCQEPSSSF